MPDFLLADKKAVGFMALNPLPVAWKMAAPPGQSASGATPSAWTPKVPCLAVKEASDGLTRWKNDLEQSLPQGAQPGAKRP